MDQQSSARWLETLRAEQRAKSQWEFKYLSDEDKAREQAEQDDAFHALGGPQIKRRTLSERDAMELRLAAFDAPGQPPAKERVAPEYELTRARVAAEVAANRVRSHRFSGDMSISSMLEVSHAPLHSLSPPTPPPPDANPRLCWR